MKARHILTMVMFLFAIAFFFTSAHAQIAVTSPANEATVSERPIVEGTVSDRTSSVWVIVHPMEISDYWVQPRVSVRDNGSWKVQIHIGRPGNADVGKVFELRAVMNPHLELHEGNVLSSWPKAAAISDVVEVTRK